MDERIYLRELAKQQAEVAALPVMKERLKKWYALNDGEIDTPLVAVEFNGPAEEFFPPLKCESQLGRELEKQIVRNLHYHEQVNDDRVIPCHVSVDIPNWVVPFGIQIKRNHASYSDGRQSMGYSMNYIIEDLEKDFYKLKKTEFHIDADLEKARAIKAEAQELLDGALPVEIQFPSFTIIVMNLPLHLMGMQNMMISLCDYPELFHKLMSALTEDFLHYMDELETAAAILPGNKGGRLGQGSWCYTNHLSAPGKTDDQAVSFADVWGYANSQETVGLSPQMFDEFFFSYMERVSSRFGLLSYGCCEPVHGIWDKCLSRLHNLRKLSVSAWCHEEELAEKIQGKKIVYHRKPSANFISVDAVFNETAFTEHIAKSVKAAAGCPLEICFREELTLRGEPWRLKRAVEIVREQFARHYRP